MPLSYQRGVDVDPGWVGMAFAVVVGSFVGVVFREVSFDHAWVDSVSARRVWYFDDFCDDRWGRAVGVLRGKSPPALLFGGG
jgi:hypothetical protein